MKAAAVAVCALLASGSARAADHEFNDIVKAISEQFDTRPMHIPLMGVAKFVVKVAHPAGTKQLNLAIFENLDEDKGSGIDLLDSVRLAVGKGWKPFLQVRGASDNNVLVYMTAKGNDVRLVVVTAQNDETVVVEVRVSPEAMQKWMTSPGEMGKIWGRDHDEMRD